MEISSLFGFGQAMDKPVRNYSNGEYLFNFGRSTSGKSVNEMTAMQTRAVYACVRILSEAVASLPIHVRFIIRRNCRAAVVFTVMPCVQTYFYCHAILPPSHPLCPAAAPTHLSASLVPEVR